MNKTQAPKATDIERAWYLVDAKDKTLGRLASEVAKILRGKHKPTFSPHVDCGDYVIVINAKKVHLTGKKWEQKKYYHHSGYPGGIKEISYDRLIEKKPIFVVEKAVKGMLPKNRLGRELFRKLKVYPGPEHPHEAQRPQLLDI